MTSKVFKHIPLIIIACFVMSISAYAQSSHKLLRKGNQFYAADEYKLAEEKYRKSLEVDGQSKTAYNLGNSLYQQERYEEAIEQFQKASGINSEELDKADVFHNMGNAYFQSQQFEEALKAYKQAVRLDPTDESTKHNLMVTKEVIKQMQQQQQQEQQQQGDQGEESENQEQNEQQDQQNQEEGENDQDQSEENSTQQDSTQLQEGGGFDSTRLEKQTLDSLDAIKLLQIIEGEEQKVQEKLRKFNSNRKKQEKDW